MVLRGGNGELSAVMYSKAEHSQKNTRPEYSQAGGGGLRAVTAGFRMVFED